MARDLTHAVREKEALKPLVSKGVFGNFCRSWQKLPVGDRTSHRHERKFVSVSGGEQAPSHGLRRARVGPPLRQPIGLHCSWSPIGALLLTVVPAAFSAPSLRQKRGPASNSPRCIRHRRRFGEFLETGSLTLPLAALRLFPLYTRGPLGGGLSQEPSPANSTVRPCRGGRPRPRCLCERHSAENLKSICSKREKCAILLY